ncbi:MAG TPA: aldo/keto reductase [Ktedonobacteraceae bacterium]|nr:aldo/keto reductase [Ktedonobacteraceae bacterium]
MQTRQFGKTDMQITPIGLGTWAVGGGNWEFGWGAQDDEESIATIHRALALGVNWIDTAAVYGLGHSEEVVARALRSRPERPYVFTKCSRIWNEKGEIASNLKADSIRREAENSLRRLQTDVIDLYQMHWPNPDQDLEEGWSAMAKLKAEGKVRYIGVSNFDVNQLRRAQEIAPIDSLQPPYSLIRPDVANNGVLDFCQQHNIAVIVYSPMASGLLTGTMTAERVAKLPDNDWRKRDANFQEPRLSRNLKLASLLSEIGYPHSRSAGEVAIAWTLQHPAVTGAIVGGRHPQQIADTVGAAEFRLSESELAQIDKFLQENP